MEGAFVPNLSTAFLICQPLFYPIVSQWNYKILYYRKNENNKPPKGQRMVSMTDKEKIAKIVDRFNICASCHNMHLDKYVKVAGLDEDEADFEEELITRRHAKCCALRDVLNEVFGMNVAVRYNEDHSIKEIEI